MKQLHQIAADSLKADETIAACGIQPGTDFFVLSASQVDALLEAADKAKYRKPKNANGSRARYFYARLERHSCRFARALGKGVFFQTRT